MGFAERPVPSVRSDVLLVQVRATAIDRADMRQRAGTYPLPSGSTDVFALEMAGEVVEIGQGGRGLVGGGPGVRPHSRRGHAEYAVVPAVLAMPVPAGLGYEQAAALPEESVTSVEAPAESRWLTTSEVPRSL
jgi:tumor protein p53-inducible protein 3